MSIRSLACAITLILLLAFQPIAANATGSGSGFSAIYVFGDSYCDVGNLFLADGGTFPISPPYFHGRFSNGLLWDEHVAGAFGLPLTPSLAGGTDYVSNGHMTLGYAMNAVPNQWDGTGRNQFEVSNSGTIYQKDTGNNTQDTYYSASTTTQWVVSE